MNIKNFIIIAILISALSVSTTLAYHLTQQANINYYQGHRFFLEGEYEKAIPYYKNALKIDPAKADALRELAYSYMWTDKPERSVKLFRESIAIDPSDQKIKTSLAEAFSWQKKYKEAIDLYKEIIVDTDDLGVKKALAEVYIWSGQPEKAKSLLENVLKKYPGDYKARLLWGKALLYSGESEKAAEIFKQLLKEEQKKKGQ